MENYIQHHGVKGQKWGVRRYQNKDGTLTRAGKRRQKIIDNEIAFQNKKIEQHKAVAKSARDSADEIRKNGLQELLDAGYDKKTAAKAVKITVGRRESEALWRDHVVKHLESYNKKLSELDVSKMNMFQVHAHIQALGNTTVNEINRTWKEPVYDD